jgi:carbonic anhydrase
MQLSRRQFVSWLGLSTVLGGANLVHGAGSPAEALSTILRDSKTKGGNEKSGHGTAEIKPKVLSSPDEIWADLLEGNRRFMAGKPKPRALVAAREELAKGQHPQVIVLGCSDSRVSPELVFDKNLGELFVVRTAGNIADTIALGSLEYAAEHLHSKVLVVLGHEKCGAVAAAASGAKMPTANLDAIVKRIFPVIEKYTICAQGDQLLGLAVEANVQQSARDVVAESPILQKEVADRTLTVIRAVYKLKTGEVYRLS